MKSVKTTLSLLLWLALATPAAAQTRLTLDDCVAEALRNNLSLRKADNDILMASEQRREALTKYFPTVTASGTGMTANENLVQVDVMGMGLGFVKNGVAANVMAKQPLFAGGQIVNSNRLARVGEDVSRLKRSLTENEVRLNTETYFWKIVQLKEKLRTIGRVEEQLRSVERDVQAAVDAGVRNRNDLLQVQLRSNEMRTSRIQVENALAVVGDLLAQQMGHAGETIDIVEPQTALPAAPDSLYVAPENCLALTHEFQLLGKQVEAEKLNYKLAVGKNLPTVAVGGAYLYNDLMDKASNKFVGLLTVSVPLSDWWGGSHAMKRQRLAVKNAETTFADQSQLLVIRMRRAWNDVTDAYKQVAIAKESIEQSEENLRLNTDYYQAGTSTMSDLLDAQTLYQQSCDRYVESLTQYEVKKREYLQATGR